MKRSPSGLRFFIIDELTTGGEIWGLLTSHFLLLTFFEPSSIGRCRFPQEDIF